MPLTPYFERAGITLYHGDCREILPQLASETFDIAITARLTSCRTPAAEAKPTNQDLATARRRLSISASPCGRPVVLGERFILVWNSSEDGA